MEAGDLLSLMEERGHPVDDSSLYAINIIGIREPIYELNAFNDTLYVLTKDPNDPATNFVYEWPITTLPGTPYLLDPLNPAGTAILVPGQYKKSYKIGLHRNKYEALIQVLPVRVYRDSNHDKAFDMEPASIEEGLFGINIHKAGVFSRIVGPSSAGCQVFQKSSDFAEFMQICRYAAAMAGSTLFTYTLIEVG